jgi:hypothetical protein
MNGFLAAADLLPESETLAAIASQPLTLFTAETHSKE